MEDQNKHLQIPKSSTISQANPSHYYRQPNNTILQPRQSTRPNTLCKRLHATSHQKHQQSTSQINQLAQNYEDVSGNKYWVRRGEYIELDDIPDNENSTNF